MVPARSGPTVAAAGTDHAGSRVVGLIACVQTSDGHCRGSPEWGDGAQMVAYERKRNETAPRDATHGQQPSLLVALPSRTPRL